MEGNNDKEEKSESNQNDKKEAHEGKDTKEKTEVSDEGQQDNIKENDDILDHWKEDFYDDTSKLSDLIRNLGFVGIAIIWIFNQTGAPNTPVTVKLPPELNSPLILLIIGLFVDIIQLLWRSTTTYIHYKSQSNKFEKAKKEIKKFKIKYLPSYIATGSWIGFIMKIILIFWAYSLILCFILK